MAQNSILTLQCFEQAINKLTVNEKFSLELYFKKEIDITPSIVLKLKLEEVGHQPEHHGKIPSLWQVGWGGG